MPPNFHFGPLKKDRKFLMHRATVADADKEFYTSYDAMFLARKAGLLYALYEKSSSFLSGSGDWNIPVSSDEELRTLLATELHCTAFHQTEALIALLLAEYQDRPDWVYLTTYGNAEIKEAAKAIKSRFAEIPGTSASNLKQLVEQGVYANVDLSKTEIARQWQESILSIMALLEIVAEQFLDGHEYNSYKHGLRVVLGSANFGIAQGELTPDKIRPFASMPHSVTFLQIENLSEDYGAQMVTKDVNPEYSYRVVQCMGSLVSLIKTFRLARIQGTLSAEINIPFYDTLLLDRIKPMTKVGFSY
jgi:hypothetical protein